MMTRSDLFKLIVFCAGLAIVRPVCAAKYESSIRYVKSVYSLPVSLDPAQMNDSASLVFSELVYEGLLRLTKDYGFEGALAQSWTTSQDGRTITFKLRPSARFHDGSLVTSADVVASFQRVVARGSKVSSYYDAIEGADAFHSGKSKAVSGLVARTPDTLEIRLSKAFPPIMYVLAGATAKVLPEAAQSDPAFFEKPIGSGPFQFVRIDTSGPHKQLFLKRSQHGRGLETNIDEFVLLESNETEARELAARGKVHDLSNWPLMGREDVFSKGQHISSAVAQTWIIGLNTRLDPFRSLDVRRTFRRDFGAEAFRKRFYPDAETAYGYIPPGFPGSTKKEAKALDVAVTRSNKSITVAIPQGLAREKEIESYIKSTLSSAGWKVSVQVLPWDKMMKAYHEKTLQAFLVSMNVDYPDSEFLLRNFESKNPDNFSGLNDQVLDRLLARARSTIDRIERERLYQQAAERLEELSPTINLFHPRAHIWLHQCVRGFEPNLLAEAYVEYSKVSLDPQCLKRGGLPR